MQKESPVHKITNLDGPSVVVPDQSLEQLVSGMHQGYCQERCVALVDAWGQELALDGHESKSLMEVIQDSVTNRDTATSHVTGLHVYSCFVWLCFFSSLNINCNTPKKTS